MANENQTKAANKPNRRTEEQEHYIRVGLKMIRESLILSPGQVNIAKTVRELRASWFGGYASEESQTKALSKAWAKENGIKPTKVR